MKLLIISAGPGIPEIKEKHGHAIDWISSFIHFSDIKIHVNHIYENQDFNKSEYDAWIITGSASSVTDNYDWIQILKNKIIYAHDNSIPILGICFGHQIIASALGGIVTKNKKGWELGSYKIKINKNGRTSPIFKNIDTDDYFYFSHEDIVCQLPLEALELANNNMGLQSFSIQNKIFGVQFHPEFDINIMDEYVRVRYEKGIINNYNQVFESKTSYKIISNFIDILKEN